MVGATALALAAIGFAAWVALSPSSTPAESKTQPSAAVLPAPSFVGHAACVECHRAQTDAWRGSQHAQAMQHATEATVRGRFDGAKFTDRRGMVSTFFKRGGKFFVRTDGADGKLADFEIKYTFGVEPLQQYLIEFPNGRLQTLSIAWDTRPAAAGGQRWFHLYPDEKIGHRDPLHWTRLNQNWNYQCAECHSTNLARNYDVERNRYATTWTDLNVACEACHGPGSNHVAWAKREGPAAGDPGKGMAIALDERRGVTWTQDPARGNAQRSKPRTTQRELDTCAVCHARRSTLAKLPGPTGRIGDTHEVSLLRPELYLPDGQQLDEVYTHGSFLQSRMHAKGVTCSDCHDPHTQKLRVPGNAVCAICHAPAKYDSTAHHLHPPQSRGAQCVACHMPARSYMVVDPRHDHSLRVPRPDLSTQLGTPNACNQCHRDRDAAWAAAAIERVHGPDRKGHQTFGGTLAAARSGGPDAAALLGIVANDAATPNIARATAIVALERYPNATTLALLERALADPDPMVRGAALEAALAFPVDVRARLAERLADDPVLAVRVRAGRALAAASLDGLPDTSRAKRERAMADYVAAQEAIAERPEAQLNLGLFYAERRDSARAEAAYRRALQLQPDFVPAYANLADFYRATNRNEEAAATLAAGLKAVPGDASLLHAQGLLRVREGRKTEALELLRRAARSQPDNARFTYVYAVALHSMGRTNDAVVVLRNALPRAPNDPDLLSGLALFLRETGREDEARTYIQRLVAVAPDDSRSRGLARALGPK